MIEVTITISLLAFLMLSVLAVYLAGFQVSAVAAERNKAQSLACNFLEDQILLGYAALVTPPLPHFESGYLLTVTVNFAIPQLVKNVRVTVAKAANPAVPLLSMTRLVAKTP